MEKVHIIHDFEVTRQRLFDFFSQHERLSEIYPGAFKRIVDSQDPSNINGLGSVRRITNFPVVFEEKITKFEVPSLIEYKISQGGGPIKDHVGTMKFYELDNGTRARLDYTIEFGSKIPFTEFIMKNVAQNVIGGGIRELGKKFLADPRF